MQKNLDEMGIGRDAFADHFFPGTSTIQPAMAVTIKVHGFGCMAKTVAAPAAGLKGTNSKGF